MSYILMSAPLPGFGNKGYRKLAIVETTAAWDLDPRPAPLKWPKMLSVRARGVARIVLVHERLSAQGRRSEFERMRAVLLGQVARMNGEAGQT